MLSGRMFSSPAEASAESASPAAPHTEVNDERVADEEKHAQRSDTDTKDAAPAQRTDGHEVDTDAESIDKDAQAGVQKMEATTKVWKWSHVVAAYIM